MRQIGEFRDGSFRPLKEAAIPEGDIEECVVVTGSVSCQVKAAEIEPCHALLFPLFDRSLLFSLPEDVTAVPTATVSPLGT